MDYWNRVTSRSRPPMAPKARFWLNSWLRQPLIIWVNTWSSGEGNARLRSRAPVPLNPPPWTPLRHCIEYGNHFMQNPRKSADQRAFQSYAHQPDQMREVLTVTRSMRCCVASITARPRIEGADAKPKQGPLCPGISGKLRQVARASICFHLGPIW